MRETRHRWSHFRIESSANTLSTQQISSKFNKIIITLGNPLSIQLGGIFYAKILEKDIPP
jgi:hypothetical protein